MRAFYSGNLQGRYRLGDPGVDGRVYWEGSELLFCVVDWIYLAQGRSSG